MGVANRSPKNHGKPPPPVREGWGGVKWHTSRLNKHAFTLLAPPAAAIGSHEKRQCLVHGCLPHGEGTFRCCCRACSPRAVKESSTSHPPPSPHAHSAQTAPPTPARQKATPPAPCANSGARQNQCAATNNCARAPPPSSAETARR